MNFDLAATCRDVVGDAVAGALLLHLLVLVVLVVLVLVADVVGDALAGALLHHLLGGHCHRRSHRSAAPSGNLQ